MSLRFTVVGAGHAGLAMAAHLSSMGYPVSLYNRGEERLVALEETHGRVLIDGIIQEEVQIDRFGRDPEEAVEGADVVMVAIPATGHRDIAELFAPFLKPGQIVILNPGRTCGALEFCNVLREREKEGVLVAETQTIIYTSRSHGRKSTISTLKKHVEIAALPSSATWAVLERIKVVYPQFVAAPNVLHTSMGNVGMILHPLPIILNTGWIEFPEGNFFHYYDGISPSIAKVLEILDRERLAVSHAYGIKVSSTLEWLQMTYGVTGENLYEGLQRNKSYRIVSAPKTLHHRFMLEDVSTGLVPMICLGRIAGVETPIAEMGVQMASLLCGIDFWDTGRNAKRLGIEGLSREAVKLLMS